MINKFRHTAGHVTPCGKSQSLLTSAATNKAPKRFLLACREQGVVPGRFVLVVCVLKQLMWLFEKRAIRPSNRAPSQYRNGEDRGSLTFPAYHFRKRYRISTSRFGTGSRAGSNQTPLGLHRIAEKIGGGEPIGTVFRSRQAIGFTWQGHPGAPITHRILWLEGLEPGRNRGGNVDTHARYVYIHGTGDETTLGRPASRGCIHVSGEDLLPLFDLIPSGTLVWIGQ
jgi:hypothetical protein